MPTTRSVRVSSATNYNNRTCNHGQQPYCTVLPTIHGFSHCIFLFFCPYCVPRKRTRAAFPSVSGMPPSNKIEAAHSLAFSLSIGFRLFTKPHLRHTELRLCRLPTTRHYVLEQGFAITRPLCFRFLLPLLRLRQKKEGAILCRVLRSYAKLTHRSVWYLPF